MKEKTQKMKTTIHTELIAPCGMNCRLCWAYIRDKNTCPGCRGTNKLDGSIPKHCRTCKIRNCEEINRGKRKYCLVSCDRFPCARLKQLDKRYRTKYGMSMIENLRMINESGIRHFIRNEKKKWICPECGEMMSVHKPTCLSCGYKWH